MKQETYKVRDLIDYDTNTYLRKATSKEARESDDAAKFDGGCGVIRVKGKRCYVSGPYTPLK